MAAIRAADTSQEGDIMVPVVLMADIMAAVSAARVADTMAEDITDPAVPAVGTTAVDIMVPVALAADTMAEDITDPAAPVADTTAPVARAADTIPARAATGRIKPNGVKFARLAPLRSTVANLAAATKFPTKFSITSGNNKFKSASPLKPCSVPARANNSSSRSQAANRIPP